MLLLDVAVVTEGSVPQSIAQSVIDQANTIYMPQLGVKLVLASYEQRDDLPTHTNPYAIVHDLYIQVDRLPDVMRVEQTADVTLFLTMRPLATGSMAYAGMASTGPACAKSQVAVAVPNYQVVAHEIAHTLGVEHDDAAGFLMASTGELTDTFSPQSIAQYQGQFHDCLTLEVAPTPAPAPTIGGTASGGGGSCDVGFLLLIGGLLVLAGFMWGRS